MEREAEPNVTFLLVDDIEENLVALEALLARPGLTLLRAKSGREALELLLTHDVALALVDVQMPEMDGFELAELMRGAARTRAVPIIFVTAAGRDGRRLFQGYEAGAVDFLFKPIDGHVLCSKADVFYRLAVNAQQHKRLALELEETLRLNELFVAAVGHDLRSPLGTMILSGAYLSQKIEDPALRRVAERMSNTGKRMARMIDDLFDLARARLGGGLRVDPKPADLREIATACVAELAALHPNRDVSLDAEGALDGAWDAGRIAQLVTNLVSNALRHGERGGPVRVHVGAAAHGHVLIRVENRGLIAAAARASLFDPFRAGSTDAKVRAEGLGLGLFIVRQIVIAHGGSISFTSEHGTTTFEVTLPRSCEPARIEATAPPRAARHRSNRVG